MIHFKGHICINLPGFCPASPACWCFFFHVYSIRQIAISSAFIYCFKPLCFYFFFSYLYFFHLFSFAISVKVAIRTRSCGPWPARYLQRWLTPKVVGCSQDEYIEHVTAHSSKRCSFSLRMFFFLSYLIFLCQGYDCQHRETSDDE